MKRLRPTGDAVPASTLPGEALRMDGADILVLSPTPTHPPDQGNRKRIHAVCTELKRRGARVHFVHYPQEWWFEFLPQDLVQQMGQAWDSFHVLPTSRHTYNPPQGQDYTIDEWWDETITTHLKWLFKRQHFDAFIVNYAYMSKAFEVAPPHVLRILDTHDLFTGRRELLERHGLRPEFFYTTRDQEIIALQRAHWIWAIKDEEAAIYREMSPTPCITVPHVEPAMPIARWRREEDEGTLVVGMLGSGNVINVQNAKAFVEEALPLFQAQGVPIQIRFMGTMCQRLGDLEGVEGVDLAGPVPEVAHFYRDVDLVIVPLAFSTGLKIKAVEAFASGVPMVAMGHALEGIPVSHPWHQCESMEEVAAICARVAAEPALLEELAQASRATHARIEAQVQAAFDAVVRRVSQRSTVIVTLDQAFFDMDSAYREQVFQTVNLLQQQSPVVLYVDQPLPTHQGALFEAFNSMAVHCKLAVAPYLVEQPARSLGLTHMVTSLADLLARHARPLLWVARMSPELVDLPAEALRLPIFLRLDLLRLLGTVPTPAALGAFSARCTELTLVDNHPNAPVPVSVGDHVRHMVVPLWRWKPGRLHIGEDGQAVHVVARPDQVDLAEALLDGLAQVHPERGPGVVITSTESVAPAMSGRVRVGARAMMLRLSGLKPLPAAVLDLSGDAYEFEALRETYRRCMVPVVQAPGQWNEAAAFRLGDLVDMLFDLDAHLPAMKEALANDVRVRYGNDAGWSSVWRALTVRSALG